VIDNKFLPEDFNLEEWRLFKKYNNRLEKQSRHIDAWFVDEPSLSEEELKKRLAYNKEHLIKDTLDQIAKGLLVEETPETAGASCGGQCEPAPQPQPQIKEKPVAKEKPEVVSYKPIEIEHEQQDRPAVAVEPPKEQQPPEKPRIVEAPQPQVEQARPPMNMPENEELRLLQDVSSKLDKLIDLAEQMITSKSKNKRQD
jgi:hypothetical protein